MSEWPEYYILIDRLPVAVDLLTWGQWFATHDRKVAWDQIGDARVSTVFLGLNHNMRMSGEPILFETMIFGGPLNDEQWRYATYAEAERGHAEAVVSVKKAQAQIKAIADASMRNDMYTIKLHQEPDCTSDNLETISQTYVDYCNRHSEFRHGSTTLYNDMGKKIGYVTALGVIWGEPVSPLLYQPPKAAKTQ